MQPPRRTISRRARLRRTIAVCIAVVATVVTIVITRPSHSSPTAAGDSTTSSAVVGPSTTAFVPRAVAHTPTRYHEVAIATLGHAVADPAAGALGAQVVFAAGLDASSTSTNRIGSITGQTVHSLPNLPSAFHDAAGAAVGNALYLFGGGNGVGQLDSIVRVDASGATAVVGRLPAKSSDSSAATIAGTAYVVGGFDGARWLDTIVAYQPQSGPRVVGHLPVGVRYAAVGAAGGRLVIAGGTTPSARATSAIYEFDPATAVVTKIGDLPQSLTHASATGVGREVVIAGGQDTNRQSLAAIVAVDTSTHVVRNAGTLAIARSDMALVNVSGRLIVIGGKAGTTTLDTVGELMPVLPLNATNIYSHDGVNALNAVAATARPLIYVPNSMSDTVSVIDPATYQVIDTFPVGALPQHVTPAWDFKTLYVDNDHGNSLTPIDPRTGKRAGPDIPVTDPYNLYFTADGRNAIVVAEARQRLDFRDAHSMKLVKEVPIPCRGVDHMDYTADGKLALASCEFSGQMVVVDLVHMSVVKTIALPPRGASPRPQDVKISPDGSVFYVADMNSNGLWEISAQSFTVIGFLPTGAGAHGLYPSRDARYLYATNRSAGTISVIDFATRAIVKTWTIPGGTPDMGGVSADGKVLWLSGRYSARVYAISTVDGHVIASIPVGSGPHGLCVWPQPGRYSIGHTGITR